jgi:hypothetical protein
LDRAPDKISVEQRAGKKVGPRLSIPRILVRRLSEAREDRAGIGAREERMFGKRIAEYLAFQKIFLELIAVVGVLRLALSLAGLPDTTVRFFSMNVVAWAGIFYYGAAVHTRGFGSYRQLLPLAFFQAVVQQSIAILGILLAIAGLPNIYAAPEYSFGAASQWLHALAHATVGIVVSSLLGWGVSSLVLWVTKRVAARPAEAH